MRLHTVVKVRCIIRYAIIHTDTMTSRLVQVAVTFRVVQQLFVGYFSRIPHNREDFPMRISQWVQVGQHGGPFLPVKFGRSFTEF